MVSPQGVFTLLIFLTMQSYKFYLLKHCVFLLKHLKYKILIGYLLFYLKTKLIQYPFGSFVHRVYTIKQTVSLF